MQKYVIPFHRHPVDEPYQEITDWWCGQRYKDLRKDGFFSHQTDIALAIHYDGVQAQNRHYHSVAPVILFNYSLPPKTRYARHNTLTSMLIPGPHEPKDLNSFLRPLVDELLELSRGISAFDAYSNSSFNLKAHAVLVGGRHLVIPYFYANDGRI